MKIFLLQLKPLQVILILIYANPPSQWCDEIKQCEVCSSIPQVSKYHQWLKPKNPGVRLDSLTPLFSYPTSDPSAHPLRFTFKKYPHSNHFLPPPLLPPCSNIMISHQDYSKSILIGLPVSVLFSNRIFSTQKPARIFQNVNRIILTDPC